MVPGVPRRAGHSLPPAVVEEASRRGAIDSCCAGSAQSIVPDVPGDARGDVPNAVGPGGIRPTHRAVAACSGELLHEDVWERLERRGATIAVVPFSGCAGAGGRVDTIILSRLDGDKLVDVVRSTARDELTYALEGPIWDRYGVFAGQPSICGAVTWALPHRSIVIAGRRGSEAFEEVVA
jgi:hypothetical protein